MHSLLWEWIPGSLTSKQVSTPADEVLSSSVSPQQFDSYSQVSNGLCIVISSENFGTWFLMMEHQVALTSAFNFGTLTFFCSGAPHLLLVFLSPLWSHLSHSFKLLLSPWSYIVGCSRVSFFALFPPCTLFQVFVCQPHSKSNFQVLVLITGPEDYLFAWYLKSDISLT